jgi:hypothetical protein
MRLATNNAPRSLPVPLHLPPDSISTHTFEAAMEELSPIKATAS